VSTSLTRPRVIDQQTADVQNERTLVGFVVWLRDPGGKRVKAPASSVWSFRMESGTDEASTRNEATDGVSSGGATLKQASLARDALPRPVGQIREHINVGLELNVITPLLSR
jgi:hypothetical protein